jgi:predicted dehydrogenase
MLRLGIMSFAHMHAVSYADKLRAHADVELIGFADDNAERRQAIASQYNLRPFDSYAALLAENPMRW